MKRIYLLSTTLLIVMGYGWMTHSLPFMSGNAENQGEQEAISKAKEQNDTQGLTPDQLWQQRSSRPTNAPAAPAGTDVVPQALLDTEAAAKAGDVRYNSTMDDVDIPPIDPNRPNYQPAEQQLPATEPEIEVVPEDLKALESQPQPEKANTNRDVPMVGEPEDYLLPDEVPPEAAESEVVPEALQIKESRQGY